MSLTADQSAAASFLLESEFAWKPQNEWANNAAKDISANGITDFRKGQFDQFPKQAQMLRQAGYHDQAKILEDHHANETERLAKEKAAAPPPPAPTPWVSQVTSTTPVPGYISPLLKSDRRKAVLAFIRHPHAKSLVDAHGVNTPGLDAKEALTRAEAAFEAYHAAQPQTQPTVAAPPAKRLNSGGMFPAIDDPTMPRTQGGKPKIANPQEIARKMGLLVGDSKAVERAKQAAAHSAAIREGRTIPADLVDKVAANLEAHGYNKAAATARGQAASPPAIQSPQAATPSAQKPIGPYVPKPGKGEPYIAHRDAMDVFWRHPDAQAILKSMGAKDDSLPRDERMRRGELAYEKYHAIKSGRPMPTSQPQAQAQRSPQPQPAAPARKPPAYTIKDEDIIQPPSRFSALVDAAKQGKLKDHLENGLGAFFDKFEKRGNKILRKIGIPAGDDEQQHFSRPQVEALNWLLSTEFARVKPSDRQRGFVFDEKPAAKGKGWVAPTVERKQKQKSFGWEEDKVVREKTAHDGKLPGEFAPKDHPVVESKESPEIDTTDEPVEDVDKPQYTAKGNEVFDANGVRHGAFRNEEKAKAAAEEWNLNGKPGAKPKPATPPASPADLFPSLADDALEAEPAPEPQTGETEQESTEPAGTKSESKPSDGVIPGMEPDQADETPREAAERQQKALDADYEFARQSAIRNAGEDLKGSARHKRNAWRGLTEAEEDGTAEQLVTRDKLLKNEPHALMLSAGENPLPTLAMFYALKAFPPQPRHLKNANSDQKRKDREQYVSAYRSLKAETEKLGKSESDPFQAMKKLSGSVLSMIKSLRGQNGSDSLSMATATDIYNPTANSLVDLYNQLRGGTRGKTSITGKLNEFAKMGAAQTGLDVRKTVKERTKDEYDAAKKSISLIENRVKDVIDGKSLLEAFGKESEAGKRTTLKPSDVYIGEPKRVGGRDVSEIVSNPVRATNSMVGKFGMRGVQWGNSVSDDERKIHAKHVVESLTDLVDALGIKPEDASIGGAIGLAIGARGRSGASAHYERSTKVINLTRANGVGTLAHEWGHALDHAMGGGDRAFLSQSYGGTDAHKAMDKVVKSFNDSGYVTRLGAAIRDADDFGVLPKDKSYWTDIKEVFARSFERYIQHKLRSKGKDNTYLSGLPGEHRSPPHHAYVKLWPTAEEAEKMAPAFDALISQYRKQKYGDEKPQEFSRDEAMSYFLQQTGEPSGFTEALAFLVENDFARKPVAPAAGQKSLFGDDGDSAVATAGNWTPPAVAAKPKQKHFGWDESKVSRESTAHDNKRPGEFAPKHDPQPEKQPDPEPEPESAPSPVAERFPSLAGDESTAGLSSKAAMPVLKAAPTAEPDVSAAGDEAFNPEKHGSYQPLLQLAQDIRDGKTSLDQYKAQHAFYRKHSAEFLADLNKRFNATQMKNIAGNFGDFSANRNTKEKNAQSIHQKLMTNAFLLSGGLQIDYMGGESYDSALDKHVGKQTSESLAAYQQKKAESAKEATKQEETKAAGIEDPKTLEDYRNVIRHYGGYDKLPEAMQARFDEFHADRRRSESEKTKATVVGFNGGNEATGATSIVEGFHQKRGQKTFTVTVEKHLGDGWDDVLSRARQLGGNYINGRIAKMYHCTNGFQFFSLADAEKFQKTLGGEDVDRSDRLDEKNIARMSNASERLAALAESTKRKAEEKLNAPRQTNTARRADMAASAQSSARSEVAKAETMQRISEGLADGKLKHLGGIRARTQVDALDKMLSNAKYKAWQDSGDTSHKSYEDQKEREATQADIAKAEYPYPRIWASELKEHLAELSEVPGLKNLARDIKKSTDKSPYKAKISGFKMDGGKAVLAGDVSHILIPAQHGLTDSNAIRVHSTTDPALLKGKHAIAYTADGGKSWGVDSDSAVYAAVKKGKGLDLFDIPEDKRVAITDPTTIGQIQKAIKILKRKSNPRLRRVAESLGMHMEDYNRLQGMDVTSPQELRAALREYAPLKKRQDKEDPVKAAERSLVGRKIAGFFPTPRPAIDRMLAAADIEPGMSVLEPSAGKGDILDAIREQHPEAKPIGIETVHELRSLIGMKGHEMHEDSDFLQHKGQYDRIVMNPPFENRQDVAHVQHAYENLKPGGKMVAIMGAGAFGGSNKKDEEFRNWLNEHNADVEDMPEGSFNGSDAFRKTGVSTRMVVIHKPDPQQFSRDAQQAMSVFCA